MTEEATPRKRGRPKGEPKPKKPSRMGRPSPWSAPALVQINTKMPAHVAKAWRSPKFKAQVDKLALDFERSKCDNNRVENRTSGPQSPPDETQLEAKEK